MPDDVSLAYSYIYIIIKSIVANFYIHKGTFLLIEIDLLISTLGVVS